ncbi:hypothetical protein EI94DRAFT_1465163, partial [Lactarius quietus]
VLNNLAVWLRALRLHKTCRTFEGMTWEEIVVMYEQATQARIALLKMLKKFEVVRRKMGID